MKFVLIITLIIIVMLIAFSVSEQYKDKYDFYCNLKSFIQQFKLNLSFKQEKILDFLNSIKCKKHFKIFIESYKKYLETGELNLQEITILDDDEIKDLAEIIKNTGSFDAKNEINQIDSFLLCVDAKLNLSLNEKNKMCPMILKLSFLFALALAIILI